MLCAASGCSCERKNPAFSCSSIHWTRTCPAYAFRYPARVNGRTPYGSTRASRLSSRLPMRPVTTSSIFRRRSTGRSTGSVATGRECRPPRSAEPRQTRFPPPERIRTGGCPLMRFGIDRLLEDPELRKPLAGRRVALLAHPASVTRNLVHSLDALATLGDVHLSAAFGP